MALTLFLPLPAAFRSRGVDARNAVVYSFYVVGSVALVVAITVFFGLRSLAGEEGKGLVNLITAKDSRSDDSDIVKELSYSQLLLNAIRLGLKSTTLALGYFGGFVARASSVGISLFIPLFVKAWFIASGLCDRLPDQSEVVDLAAEDQCGRAYVVAAELTGVSQLVALVFAPVFGYLADRYSRSNAPLIFAALVGMLGYTAFANLDSPDPTAADGSPWIFLVMALLGISQIGAIVCSLGLLGRSVLEAEFAPQTSDIETHASDSLPEPTSSARNASEQSAENLHSSASVEDTCIEAHETSGLLGAKSIQQRSHQHLKGSIAGVYSLVGGAGILILTKLGGHLFDQLSPSAPFYMLAGFNGILSIFGIICGFSSLQFRR